jgi:putative ABC transport system ATP-binding protein
MPAMTALENVDLGLRIAGTDRREADRRARESLEQVGLGDRFNHRPAECPGGQQQRVAVARAIATGNRLLLADEYVDAATHLEGGRLRVDRI